jgi:hypothetical protein
VSNRVEVDLNASCKYLCRLGDDVRREVWELRTELCSRRFGADGRSEVER